MVSAPAPPGRTATRYQTDGPAHAASSRFAPLLLAVAVGTLVSVGLGVYGRLHEPTFFAISVAGFSSGTAVKAWLGTAAFALVLVQMVSARMMYRGAGPVVAGLHRWSGRAAVLVTVPVAVHCLYALGYQDTTLRVALHSIAGCFVYGAFAAKMLVLGRSRSPRWAIPVLGGLLFVGLTALWLSSSLWFFTTTGLTF